MKRRILLSLAFFIVLNTQAQDEDKVKMITDELEEGKFLIYDCEKKHWACVAEEHFNDCKKNREEDLQKADNPYHSCAVFISFSKTKSCNQRILFLTSNNYGNRFCIKDSWKLKTEKL